MLSRIFIVHLEQIKGTSKVLLEPIIVSIQTAFYYLDFVLILLLVTFEEVFLYYVCTPGITGIKADSKVGKSLALANITKRCCDQKEPSEVF